MKLSELMNGTGTEYTQEMPDWEICGISSRSSSCQKGYVYICIKGLHADGHSYMEEAVENGAVVIVTERSSEEPVSDVPNRNGEKKERFRWYKSGVLLLSVENTRVCETRMWENFTGSPQKKMNFIGVTGTNGKSSTVLMLRSIFREAGVKTGVIGSIVCMIGDEAVVEEGEAGQRASTMTTPEPEYLYPLLARMAEAGVRYVLMEITSHALAAERVVGIHFSVAVFTNLTRDHLDFHGSMERYKREKAKLFAMCDTALINADDPHSDYFVAEARAHTQKVYCYSEKDTDADFSAMNRKTNACDGVTYMLLTHGMLLPIFCPIPGKFNVANSMAAAAASYLSGISEKAITDGLLHMPKIPGRMETIGDPAESYRVMIDYAHTPDALAGLLCSAREMLEKGKRLTVLFGCGGDRDKGKRAKMGNIASTLADRVIITSDNSRSERPADIISDIMTGVKCGTQYVVCENREEAIRYAISTATDGELILLAGKGHETYEITAEGKHSFSEKTIVEDEQKKKKTNE